MVLLAATALAACAGPQPPLDPVTAATPEEFRVKEPRDARGIGYCDLLTRGQLLDLGLIPDTALPAQGVGSAGRCSWVYADDALNRAVVTVRTDSPNPVFYGYYRIRGANARYELIDNVAGHPAASYNPGELVGCVVTVGVADDQGIEAQSNALAPPTPEDCGRSRRMAELILANLPLRR